MIMSNVTEFFLLFSRLACRSPLYPWFESNGILHMQVRYFAHFAWELYIIVTSSYDPALVGRTLSPTAYRSLPFLQPFTTS
jgi:hypothetical protein